MNKIKAIILDLDGTLLDDNKNIGEKTKKVLKNIKNDIKIVLASARQFCRIRPYLEDLDLIQDNNYTICFNGSLVVDNNDNEIFSSYINENTILSIDNFILDNNDVEWTYYTYENRFKRNEINDMNKFISENKIFKIVGLASQDRIEDIKSILPKGYYDIVEVTNSENGRIEFVNKGMTKVKAIKIVLDKLNISKENVIAIGDGDNDIEMLEYASLGIAMKNSPDIVKNKADIITKYTNNEDGVGIMVEELIEKTSIPSSILECGFDFSWNEKAVWELNYPSELIDMKVLEWNLELPFWDYDGENYVLCPLQIIRNPEKYSEHYDRVMKSDIEYPIDIMENKGRYAILDGMHRLVKYKMLGYKKVKVRIIPRDEIKNISI